MKKQDFFVTFLSLVAFRLGDTRALGPPTGYAYDCNFNLFVILRFWVFFAGLPVCVCQNDTNGFIVCMIMTNRPMWYYW